MANKHPDITQQVSIIHLSDLHFGDTHIFRIPNSVDGDMPKEDGYPTLIEKLYEEFNDISSSDNTIICITGDFVDKGDVNQFEQAENFINDLLNHKSLSHLSINDIFIVPGNHDVDYTSSDLGIRFRQYIEFFNRLFNSSIKREEPSKIPMVHNLRKDRGAIVVCLNSSTYVEKGTQDEKRGRIGIKDLEQLQHELESLTHDDIENAIKIALIHHHPILIPSLAESNRGYDAVHNSEKLISILKRFGFHVILHGHKHNPHTFTEDINPAYKNQFDNPIFVIAGGSVGSSDLPDNPYCINCYNRITIKWHPKGQQTRIRVETRGLRTYDLDGNKLLPTRWKWETMSIDDRHFVGHNNTPLLATNYSYREFHPEDEKYETLRRVEYENSRGNLPVLNVLPSLINDQVYEVVLWIVQHPYGQEKPSSDIPSKVIYCAGKRFEVVEVLKKQSEHFTAKLTYYGPMLVQCRMIFEDGHEHICHIYARMPNQY